MSNKILVALAAFVILYGGQSLIARASDDAARYEFLKASEDRVWRLNKQTGEISVCSLEREALVCTTSSRAAQMPETSYEQLEEREAAARAADELKDAEERARALKLLDGIMDLVRQMAEDSAPAGDDSAR